MRFQVPQFIDIEDKIFGPFTFKQFIYLLGGGSLAYIAFRSLPKLLGIPLALAAVILALLLTFYKINNKPFIFMLQAWFRHVTSPHLYVWKQRQPEPDKKVPQKQVKAAQTNTIPALTESKLDSLAWSLDVKDITKK